MSTPPNLLTAEPFAQAKARLSELMSQAVHHHQPVLIDRHRGRERALLVGAEDVAALLESFRFEPVVGLSDGEFVVRLPQINLIAGGESYEDAIAELVELIEEYAEDFLERWEFYRHTNRWQHAPWLLRFALTPPTERRDLLTRAAAGEEEPPAAGTG
jgi:predicted RNase H-like HicB family nuclease